MITIAESPPPVVKAKRKAYVKKEKKEKPPKKVVEKKINEKGHSASLSLALSRLVYILTVCD